jgi:hypothetical protein
VVVDELFRKVGDSFGVVAYAADIVILVEGNSRQELVNRGRVASGIIDGEEKMLVSKEKRMAPLLKGTFHKDRMPRVDVGAARIRFVESFT